MRSTLWYNHQAALSTRRSDFSSIMPCQNQMASPGQPQPGTTMQVEAKQARCKQGRECSKHQVQCQHQISDLLHPERSHVPNRSQVAGLDSILQHRLPYSARLINCQSSWTSLLNYAAGRHTWQAARRSRPSRPDSHSSAKPASRSRAGGDTAPSSEATTSPAAARALKEGCSRRVIRGSARHGTPPATQNRLTEHSKQLQWRLGKTPRQLLSHQGGSLEHGLGRLVFEGLHS
jgi:hypothetical protein